MVGLKGSRVIVVDDELDDALPILKALAKKGIAAAFFTGSVEDVPPEDQRLYGVRLAILDMDLTGGGTDDKTKVSALLNFIGKVLHPENGPYAVVAWTKHAELTAMFDERLFTIESLPKPIVTIKIEKADCKKDDQFDLTVVSSKLEEALAKFSPLLFLAAWEEKCYAAATGVTNALSILAEPELTKPETWRETWKVQLLQLMHAMAEAESGSNIVDGSSGLIALYTALNPLHADRMESSSANLPEQLRRCSMEIVTKEASEDCGAARKAKINTMLHSAFDQLDRFRPGNVYLHADVAGNTISIDELIEDVAQKNHGSEIKQNSTPIVVEVSPVCDYVQGNIRSARLVGGLFVPVSLAPKIKHQADFIWPFGPIFFNSETLQGEYRLFLSARHIMNVSPVTLGSLKAIMRLRLQALTHLQVRLGYHASRPGMLSLA